MTDLARSIADRGFVVTIADLYDGEIASTVEDAEALMGRIIPEQRQPRFDSAVAHLLGRQDRAPRPIGAPALSMAAG